jgi:hypothetical protein
MPKGRLGAEQIVTKLRQVEVLQGARQERCCGLQGDRSDGAELRDECLNGEIFYSLKEAQTVIESWRTAFGAWISATRAAHHRTITRPGNQHELVSLRLVQKIGQAKSFRQTVTVDCRRSLQPTTLAECRKINAEIEIGVATLIEMPRNSPAAGVPLNVIADPVMV